MRSAALSLLMAFSALAQAEWQPYVSKEFSVSMPGRPEVKARTLTTPNGHPVEYTTYTVDLGRSVYMMSTSDYDDETRISLDGAIDGAMSAWKDPQIISKRRTTLYGHPAQVVDFTSEDYRVIIEAVAVGKRLYQLAFLEKRDDFLPAHASSFMSSFRLR